MKSAGETGWMHYSPSLFRSAFDQASDSEAAVDQTHRPAGVHPQCSTRSHQHDRDRPAESLLFSTRVGTPLTTNNV